MASSERREARALELFQSLEHDLHRFGFFQLLRLVECCFEERPRLGRSRRPEQDPLRIGQQPSLAFAPSTLAKFQAGREGLPPLLTVNFFGLFGPNGALPLHLTEYARDRLRRGDATFSRFADMLHHRLLTLFYRAWADCEPTVQLDRPEADRFTSYMASLVGLGAESLRERDILPDYAKLQYAGLFANQSRSAEGLGFLLSEFFELPVRIEEFVGQWIPIPWHERCRLGESRATGLLGENLLLGSAIYDRAMKFRVVVGPVSFEEYLQLLPGGPSFSRLTALVLNYAGMELLFDVQFVVRGGDVPELKLDGSLQLGLSTWATSRELYHDPDDLIINLMEEELTWADDPRASDPSQELSNV